MHIDYSNKAIIKAPSILGLKETGVDGLPEALLFAGLSEGLSAHLAGYVASLPYNRQRDPQTGFLNSSAIAKYTVDLSRLVGVVLERGEFPVVLGGDCSIILGCMLALRRRGCFGLFFMDGHTDFYQPEENINGEVASSDLALVTGHGPTELTVFEDFCPLVHDEDVVCFGFRDEEEQKQYGSQPLPEVMFQLNLASIRRLGVADAADKAVEYLHLRRLDGVWLHLDADVLSDDVMPAVDYRLPDGLSWDELATTLKRVYNSGMLAGLDVTIYNPCLDTENRSAKGLAQTITHGLTEIG